MILYKVLKSKSEIDLAFFLAFILFFYFFSIFILFSLVRIGTELCTTKFLTARTKEAFVMKTFCSKTFSLIYFVRRLLQLN